MCTRETKILKLAARFGAAICAVLALAAGPVKVQAQPAPPNDNLINAQGIMGVSGSAIGTNLYATVETNETTPYSSGASVWYLWTAPITTTIDFNTRGSTDPILTDPDAGDDLDTVLAVYSLKSGTNVAYTNLNVLATNDDDPSGGVVSRVDVPVTVGHVYLIQVLGSSANPTGTNAVAEGDIVLSWSPSLVGGNFGFSTTTYTAGDLDDIMPVTLVGNPDGPSLANAQGTNNVRITITRTGGNVGKCEVTLVVTNLTYTNLYETDNWGTNVYTTNYSLAGAVISFSNYFYTNIASEDFIANNLTYGGFFSGLFYFPTFSDESVVQTNLGFGSNSFFLPAVTNVLSLSGLGLTNFFTNFPCNNQIIQALPVTNTTVTNAEFVTLTTTQLFCYYNFTNDSTVSASNGVDYRAVVTNLVFNDFQMSKDFYIQINPSNTYYNTNGGIGNPGPDWPDANSNYTFYGANALLSLSLTNVMLDSNEDLDITPPTLASSSTNTTLTILNFNGNADNYFGSGSYLVTNPPAGESVVINLERATFRVNKGTATAYAYVLLSGIPGGNSSYTLHYTIDCAGVYGGSIGTPLSAFNWNQFPTVADSDYAEPSYSGSADPDFGNPINQPYDPSGYNVGRNSTFPATLPYIGSITLGPFPGNPPVGEIAIPILNNGAAEFDMDVLVQIFETASDATGNAQQMVPGFLGNISSANLTINFAGKEPGGANDTSFNLDGSASSSPPNNPVPGANGGPVSAVVIQPNGQAIIGGYFSSYNTVPIYGVARLLANGFLDTSFNVNSVNQPGVNYGGFVTALALDTSGRVIIGGSFQSYNGTNAVNIARLNPDGSLDKTFNTGIGFNGIIYALSIDANSNILVGGDFSSYNTTNCNNLARLLPTGGLDPTFLPNTANGNANIGTDQEVRSIATDLYGNIVLGGGFSFVNGSNMNYVARLLPSGAVDPSFNPEIGPDDEVYSVAVRSDNEILIGGAFQNYNLVSRAGVALLATSGTLDTTFTPGTGADGVVYSVVFQPDGNILVGGQFRTFNTSRRLGVARLLPSGWIDTSFMDTSFNQYAGLINAYYNQNVDPVHIAYALALQPDGNIIVGGSFTNVGGGGARDEIHTKINVARLIGASTPGPQTGGGGIGNFPGNITLGESTYTVDDTSPNRYVTLDRVNGSLGPAQVTIGTNTLAPGPGSATAADFGLVLPGKSLYNEVYKYWITNPYGDYEWRQCDGYYGYNNAIQPITDFGDSAVNLRIYDDKTALQDLFASISLLNINSQDLLILGGVSIPLYPALGVSSAPLEIINDNFPAGELGFSATNYVAINTSSNVTITVVRTNGVFGPVSVEYYTANGTASSNQDYIGVGKPSSKTVLNFPGGTNNTATFTIPILDSSTLVSSRYFKLFLTDPSGGAALDTNIPPLVPSNSIVTIIDGNFAPGHLSFSSPTYSVLKGGTATISVVRTGGALGELTVQVGTANGTAVNGLNYSGVTNTLTWSNQDISTKTITIQSLQDNTVEGPKTVNFTLFNATNVGGLPSNNGLILVNPSTSVLTIEDSDSYGNVNFSVPNFNVLQNSSQALITVVRTNGTTGSFQLSYATFDDSNAVLPYLPAQAGTNYGATNGTLTFGSNVTSQSFVVPIYYTPDETNAANRVVTLEVYGGTVGQIASQLPIFATLTILDPQLILNPAGSVDMTAQNGTGFNGPVNSLALQPDGSVLAGGAFSFFDQYPFENVARLFPSAAFDSSFLFNQTGANSNVSAVVSQTPSSSQTNGPIVVAGDFSQVDGVNRSGIARLNLDGSIDETFSPGSGADNAIYAIAETFLPAEVTNQPPTIAYYIGGSFANFDGTPSGGIARLNGSTNSPGYQGAVDPNFNVGQGVTGSNAVVRAVAVQANNQVILGGDFTAFNGQTYNHLVRLNIDGSVDTNFNAGTTNGPNAAVEAITIQTDGKILIGGQFTNVDGTNCNYLARLNIDGSLDTAFAANLNGGGNNIVLAVAVDSQARILVGGEFTEFSSVTRSGVTRLNPDGSVDPTINFQAGANGGFVDTIVIQTNDEIDLGGGFATFGSAPENNFVRVYGGANSGDGTLQFSQSVFGVLESGTNATVTVQRLGGEGTSNQPTVTVVFSTSDGTAAAGTDYISVTTNLTFPMGETFQSVTIPILTNTTVGSNKVVNLSLSSPVNGALGSQSTATLIITNVNSQIEFGSQTYNQSADAPGGNAIISVVRIGNTNNTEAITVYTGTNGTATPYTNYIPTTNTIVFNPGVVTNYFLVPVLNATNMFSDQTVDLELTSPSNTILGAPSSATLVIGNVLNGPGVISFSATNYTVQSTTNGNVSAVITLVRTNGSFGSVSVVMTTSNGTAISGLNYTAEQITNNFSSGQVSQTVTIPILSQVSAGPNTTFYLNLSNPTGGATIGGPTQVPVTIENEVEYISFASSFFFVNEGATNAVLQLVRGGEADTPATVTYFTPAPTSGESETNGFALPGVDYGFVSNTITFVSNELHTITVPIIQGTNVDSPISFNVVLTNASTGVEIAVPGTNTVTILCDVTGFEFDSTNLAVGENGSNIVITVDRLNPNTGVASVQFSNIDGTAISGVDYVATNGTLVFSNGVYSNSFTVTILNPNIVEQNKTFTLSLFNPQVLTLPNPSTNAYVLAPSNLTTVTITNVLSGVAFQSSSYTVSKCAGIPAAIPVVLTGVTNGIVNVTASTSTNGSSGIPGSDYILTTTTLSYSNGATVQTMYVPIIDNGIIGPDKTVTLTLSNPQGATLLNPNTAVLTIQECTPDIVASGTAFVSGNMTPLGTVLPNETVTILFGLRNIAGSNTTQLVATLLATNGVTNVSGPQNYGALVSHGATVSMPFTFKATGAAGQNVVATFALQDGSATYSNVFFSFNLAGGTTTFSTNEALNLYGSNNPPSKAYNNNPPNYGYPSEISVSGVVGTITAISASVSNFSHSYPSDVAALLEGPSGTNTYLFADCGGSTSISGVNLTFSQSAGSSLPESNALTSGTYLPTTYSAPPFPVTLVTQPQVPLSPYPTSLASFVGQSPNGTWYLFVADENQLDSGSISKGWSLSISTGLSVAEDSDLETGITVTPTNATTGNPLVYTVTVTNVGPAEATNIIITDSLPLAMVSNLTDNASAGFVTLVTNGSTVTWSNTIATLAVGSIATNVIQVYPTTNALGAYLTNIAVAIADQPDPNSNNVQTNILLVSPPSADVGVSLAETPNPVLNGSNVTYTITVTNGGPSIATSVMVTNFLPSGFVPISYSPAPVSTNGNIVWSVGNLGSITNNSTTISLVAGVFLSSSGLPSSNNIDNVLVGSTVFDPVKLNNVASAKTVVNMTTNSLLVSSGGASHTLTWSSGGNFQLVGSVLWPPKWMVISNATSPYTLPGTNGYHFFTLMAKP